MSIGTSDQEVGIFFPSDPDQRLRTSALLLQHDLRFALDAVIRQIMSDVLKST